VSATAESSGLRVVTRRLSRDGASACLVVEAESAPPEGCPHEPTLEDAYGAFLVGHGIALEVEQESAG
jgi:hypothetical protein